MNRNLFKKYAKSNLFQYFYYFVLLSLIVIILLGASIYIYVSQVIKQQVIDSNNNTLIHIKNAQQAVLQEVDKSLANVAVDSTINNFMDYYNAHDNVMLLSIQKKLSSVLAINQYIESIYVYYCKYGYVLSSDDGILKIDDFFDSEFVRTLEKNNIWGSNLISRLQKDENKNGSCSLISFIRSLPVISSNIRNTEAFVVMNIKSVYLQNGINEINTREHANIIIIDSNGNIISQSNDSMFDLGDDILQYLTFKGDESFGYSTTNIKGVNTLVSYVSSDVYNWTYVYLLPMHIVTSPVRVLLKIIVILCFFVLSLSISGAIFMSNRLYIPIKSLLSLFSKEYETPKKTSEEKQLTEEIKTIKSNINVLISKNRSLEVVLNDYNVYLKNKFLQSVISKNIKEVNKVLEGLKHYKISLHENGYFIGCVVLADGKLDCYENYYGNIKEVQDMLFIYLNEIRGSIFENYRGFIAEGADDNVTIVINIEDNTSISRTEVENKLYNFAKHIHLLITNNLKYSFTMGVSTIYKGIENIPDCYNDGVNASNYRLLFGYNQVIFYDRIKTFTENKISYPFSIDKDILINLKIGNRDGVMKALNDFIDYIYLNPINDIDLIRHYFLQLISGTVKCLYEMNKSFNYLSLTEIDIYDTILKLNTIQEMRLYFENFYNSILKYSEEQRKVKNKEIVKAIIEYIDDNLHSDLCVDKLSDVFFISSSHIRKIVKEEIGMTIKEYIDGQRIMKAKSFLESTNDTVTKISEKVGYSSIQAFTRAFKLHTGKTPSDYRTGSILKTK